LILGILPIFRVLPNPPAANLLQGLVIDTVARTGANQIGGHAINRSTTLSNRRRQASSQNANSAGEQ
jgi:hypothetical protein